MIANRLDPKLIDSLITDLLGRMSLEDRVNIANLSEDDIRILESVMGKYLKIRSEQLSLDDEMEAKDILREVYKRLKETHRMRVVK
jgi:hypothetical protein